MAGRARVERGVEAGADLLDAALQLLALEERHEGGLVQLVALKTPIEKRIKRVDKRNIHFGARGQIYRRIESN